MRSTEMIRKEMIQVLEEHGFKRIDQIHAIFRNGTRLITLLGGSGGGTKWVFGPYSGYSPKTLLKAIEK